MTHLSAKKPFVSHRSPGLCRTFPANRNKESGGYKMGFQKLGKSMQLREVFPGRLGSSYHMWDANHYFVAEKYTQQVFE